MPAEEHFHRVHAIQIVVALPNNLDDALLVLRAAERLVRGFLIEPEPVKAPQILGGKAPKSLAEWIESTLLGELRL